MFDSIKCKRFRLFLIHSHRLFKSNPYIFLEDIQDISDNYLVSYSPNIEDPNGKIIRTCILITEPILKGEMHDLIKMQTNFKDVYIAAISSADLALNAIFGVCDIYWKGLATLPQVTSLLPAYPIGYQIWIPNLEYEKSPTFFLKTFSPLLWSTYGLSFLLLLLLIFLTIKCINRLKNSNFSYFSIVASIAGDEPENYPPFITFKLLLICMFLLLILFQSSFEAFLSALMSVATVALPFTNLQELVQRSDYTICGFTGTPPDLYFRYHDASLKAKYNDENCPNYARRYNWTTPFYCTKKNLAFIAEPATFWKTNLTNTCQLSSLSGKYITVYRTVLVHRGFRYKEHFNRATIKLQTSAIFAYFSNLRRRGFNSFEVATYDNLDSIEFRQIKLILAVLITGVFLSIIIMILEIIWKQYNKVDRTAICN